MKKSKEQISYNMSRVRNKGSIIEKRMAISLRKNKIGFRGHPELFGKPDFVVKNKKIAIFCDSSFWHGYKFLETNRHRFKSNRKFWVEKISRNMKRDKVVNRRLNKMGWCVLRFLDFRIRKDPESCVKRILSAIESAEKR